MSDLAPTNTPAPAPPSAPRFASRAEYEEQLARVVATLLVNAVQRELAQAAVNDAGIDQSTRTA
jgi:hypothetical protein